MRVLWYAGGRVLYRGTEMVGVMDTDELAREVADALNKKTQPATRRQRFIVEVVEDANQGPVSKQWVWDLLLKTPVDPSPLTAGGRKVTVTEMED